MVAAISRADFLRGKLSPRPQVLRPPYAASGVDFFALCNGCGDCQRDCPEDMIALDAKRRPLLRFGQGECTFCGECARVCATDALDVARAESWNVRAEIRATCVSMNGVVCRSCEENCHPQAIRFTLLTEGRGLPIVDEDICTGCGACVARCPVDAIEMKKHSEREMTA